MTEAKKVTVFKDGTNVRRGGSTHSNPGNVIGVINAGEYLAFAQCAGQEVEEAPYNNYWWVLLDTPAGKGWVSAARIKTGRNDQPIPGVPTAETTFAVPGLFP